jgi:hypothetical protein
MPMKNPNHPGDIIRDCLDELGVNVTDGAKALGVTRATLSRLINRKAGSELKWPFGSKRQLAARRAFGFDCNSTMTWRRYRRKTGKSTSAAWAPQLSLRGECAAPESGLAFRLDVKARCRSRSGHAI